MISGRIFVLKDKGVLKDRSLLTRHPSVTVLSRQLLVSSCLVFFFLFLFFPGFVSLEAPDPFSFGVTLDLCLQIALLKAPDKLFLFADSRVTYFGRHILANSL